MEHSFSSLPEARRKPRYNMVAIDGRLYRSIAQWCEQKYPEQHKRHHSCSSYLKAAERRGTIVRRNPSYILKPCGRWLTMGPLSRMLAVLRYWPWCVINASVRIAVHFLIYRFRPKTPNILNIPVSAHFKIIAGFKHPRWLWYEALFQLEPKLYRNGKQLMARGNRDSVRGGYPVGEKSPRFYPFW